MKPTLSSFFNVSRGAAAALVLFDHVRHLLLADFNKIEHKTVTDHLVYLLTGFGHEAVVLFFVISGYLVGGLTIRRWRQQGPDLAHFAAARISRIYTVLLPTLAIGFALDFCGQRWLNSSGVYTATLGSQLNLGSFVANLFMMQGVLANPLGTNGPLWSLAYEWWYYCAFALVALAITDNRPRRFVYVLGTVALGAALPPKLVLWSSIWGFGVFVALWVDSKLWRPRPVAGLCLFGVAMICSRLSHNVETATYTEPLWTEFSRDALLALAYSACLCSVSGLQVRIPMARFFDWTAKFSYTTYLCHYPALVALVAIAHRTLALDFGLQPSTASFAYLGGYVIILYLYAYLIYWLTERHTNSMRDWLTFYFPQSLARV